MSIWTYTWSTTKKFFDWKPLNKPGITEENPFCKESEDTIHSLRGAFEFVKENHWHVQKRADLIKIKKTYWCKFWMLQIWHGFQWIPWKKYTDRWKNCIFNEETWGSITPHLISVYYALVNIYGSRLSFYFWKNVSFVTKRALECPCDPIKVGLFSTANAHIDPITDERSI